jgi:hypothetical protein
MIIDFRSATLEAVDTDSDLLLQNDVQLLSSVPGFTDLIPAQIRELLAGIYSQVYVEYAVKVPTYSTLR